MKIEVRKLSATVYELEVEDVKLVSAKISIILYQLLEQRTKNKSEFIRRVITEILNRNIDLTNIALSNEYRNKVITFRIEYAIYNKIVEYAQRYQSINEFMNRAIWWGINNDSICL